MTKLQQAYNRVHDNFMTPTLIKAEFIGKDRIIELSSGIGLNNKPLYGVTEFVYDGTSLDTTRRGNCFGSRTKANQYFKNLVENTYHE